MIAHTNTAPPVESSPQFASLATKLINRSAGNPIHVAVTSSQNGEGVSTVAAELAIACSEAGAATLLLDANLANPSQHFLFDLDRELGLADILHGSAGPEAIESTDHDNLHVVTAGSTSRCEKTTISGGAFRRLLDGLALRFQVIIVDGPTADAGGTICAQTHGVLLVVEAEGVRRQVVQNSRTQLEANGANILGVVLNKRKQHVPDWIYRRL